MTCGGVSWIGLESSGFEPNRTGLKSSGSGPNRIDTSQSVAEVFGAEAVFNLTTPMDLTDAILAVESFNDTVSQGHVSTSGLLTCVGRQLIKRDG